MAVKFFSEVIVAFRVELAEARVWVAAEALAVELTVALVCMTLVALLVAFF